jgi:hypothetical protein
MHQIIEENLQLIGVPQCSPGAAKHATHKESPQLAEGRFNALAYLTEEKFMLRDTVPRNEQHPAPSAKNDSALPCW